MAEAWSGGNDNLGGVGRGGRGAPPLVDLGLDFGPDNGVSARGGRGRGVTMPMADAFSGGNDNFGGAGGGRGGALPPMDFGSNNSGVSARGGRGRGALPPMAEAWNGGNDNLGGGRGGGRGALPPMAEAWNGGNDNLGGGRGGGRGALPPMAEAWNGGNDNLGGGRGGGRGALSPMAEAWNGGNDNLGGGTGGRGRGALPPMDSGTDFGPDNSGVSARGGRGRGAPPLVDLGLDFGPETNGVSARGRGRGAPMPMADAFNGGNDNFGGADGGRGTQPPMDSGCNLGGEGFVPTKRSIAELFEEDARVKDKYITIREEDENVIIAGPHADEYKAIERWSEFEFEPALLTNIQKANYTVPRKIQSLTFPLIKAGHDLKGHAETGSGKSAAFLLPIIDAVMKLKKGGHYKSRRCCPFALIVEPTRELTVQVYDQARKLAEECDVSVSRAYGMFLRHVNLRQISTDGCDILVGTPGRLCDFFQSKNLLCDQIKVLVFDEADQLLEDGFQAVLRQLNNVNNWPQPENRQTLLFSATFPLVVQNWADEWMRKDSMMVSNKRLVAANSRIKQKFLMVPNTAKKDVLLRLFQLELQTAKKRDPVNGKIRNTMVFVNTKRDADVVSTYLNQFDFNTTTINGNRPQEMREKALSDFRAGVYQIVVTTDVCARGHDLKDLDHVINMDLPASGEGIDDSFTTYVHRIGRTGRLQPGSATTFFDIQADGTMAEGFVQSLQEATQPVPDWLNKLVAREPIAGSGQVTDEELLGIL